MRATATAEPSPTPPLQIAGARAPQAQTTKCTGESTLLDSLPSHILTRRSFFDRYGNCPKGLTKEKECCSNAELLKSGFDWTKFSKGSSHVRALIPCFSWAVMHARARRDQDADREAAAQATSAEATATRIIRWARLTASSAGARSGRGTRRERGRWAGAGHWTRLARPSG